MQQNMFIQVYVVPGGEPASWHVYDDLVCLSENYPDLFLTVYRAMNRTDGRWVITLIGEQTSCARYHEQIQRPLEQVQATPVSVPPEQLTPLITHFLQRQAEMAATKTPFLETHHPLSKRQVKKKSKTEKQKKQR